MPASIPRTSSRSPSRARRPPRCASGSSPRCARRRPAASFRRRAGASCATAPATSRSAPSTPSACRCCASFRSRPISIPASRWPTKPRCRVSIDESLDRALRTAASLAREDEQWRWCSRSSAIGARARGLAALLEPAARGAGRPRRDIWPTGPRDLDVVTAAAAATGALLDVFDVHAGRPRALSRLRPARARRSCCSRATSARVADSVDDEHLARSRHRAGRVLPAPASYFLTQDGEPRKPLSVRRSRIHFRHRLAAHRDLVVGHAAAIVDASAALSPRSERARLARRVGACTDRRDRVSPHARCARGARFPRLAAPRAGAARARWRSSRRAAIGSSRAITTCWWTSSRTPAAPSGSSCRLLVAVVGRGRRADVQRSTSTVDLHRRRSQAVDLRASATPTCRCSQDARRHIEVLRPDGDVAARRSRAASGRCRRCWRSSTTCRVTSTKSEGTPDAFRLRRRGSLSDRRGRNRCGRPFARHWSPATHPTRAPKPRLRKLRVCSPRGRSFATRSPASGGRSRRRHRHSVSHPRQPPRIRGRARPARHRRIRLQRSRVLRRRRNQGRARAALVSRRSGVGSPCRGASAIARLAPLGRGDSAAGAEPRRIIARRGGATCRSRSGRCRDAGAGTRVMRAVARARGSVAARRPRRRRRRQLAGARPPAARSSTSTSAGRRAAHSTRSGSSRRTAGSSPSRDSRRSPPASTSSPARLPGRDHRGVHGDRAHHHRRPRPQRHPRRRRGATRHPHLRRPQPPHPRGWVRTTQPSD